MTLSIIHNFCCLSLGEIMMRVNCVDYDFRLVPIFKFACDGHTEWAYWMWRHLGPPGAFVLKDCLQVRCWTSMMNAESLFLYDGPLYYGLKDFTDGVSISTTVIYINKTKLGAIMPIVFFHLHAYQIFIQINEFSYNENVTFRVVYKPKITEDLELICLILSHFQVDVWTSKVYKDVHIGKYFIQCTRSLDNHVHWFLDIPDSDYKAF